MLATLEVVPARFADGAHYLLHNLIRLVNGTLHVKCEVGPGLLCGPAMTQTPLPRSA